MQLCVCVWLWGGPELVSQASWYLFSSSMSLYFCSLSCIAVWLPGTSVFPSNIPLPSRQPFDTWLFVILTSLSSQSHVIKHNKQNLESKRCLQVGFHLFKIEIKQDKSVLSEIRRMVTFGKEGEAVSKGYFKGNLGY